MILISTCERRTGSAALPPHTAESLRLSDESLIHFCGEAEPRRNLKNQSQR